MFAGNVKWIILQDAVRGGTGEGGSVLLVVSARGNQVSRGARRSFSLGSFVTRRKKHADAGNR